MTTASTPIQTAATEAAATAPDAAAAARAASQADADQQVRHAATRWLTSDQVTLLGQHLVRSIDRYQRRHGRPPTWADALTGVDPSLLAPIHAVPNGWPYRPAFWRRALRQHLMTQLRRTRWISYTRTPRSLQPGDQGRSWLRTAHPTETVTQPQHGVN